MTKDFNNFGFISNEIRRTGKPVLDSARGMTNPLVLTISSDTLNKLKAKKPIEINICEKCFCTEYCPDKNNKEIVDWCKKEKKVG